MQILKRFFGTGADYEQETILEKLQPMPIAMNNALVKMDQDGQIEFESTDDSGAGIFIINPKASEWNSNTLKTPHFLRIEYSLSSGAIYAQLFEQGLVSRIGATCSDEKGRGEINIYLEELPPSDAVLMIGIQQTGVKGRIKKIRWLSCSSTEMHVSEYKKTRAESFSHWYYTLDLGDGVSRAATILDEKNSMQGLLCNRDICLSLIDEHLGNIAGLKILDLACSAGFHSFELAKRGAIVTGIDWDSNAIAQAKFIQECIGEKFPHKVEFQCISVLDFDPPKHYFDYIYCSGLMYHLQDPIGVAKRMRDWCSRGVIVQSCVTPKEGDLFELSEPGQFPFCGPWEFALVPTGTMLRKVFEYAGFNVVRFASLQEFKNLSGYDSVLKRFPANNLETQSLHLRGPVYLVGKVCK